MCNCGGVKDRRPFRLFNPWVGGGGGGVVVYSCFLDNWVGGHGVAVDGVVFLITRLEVME